MNNPFQCVCVNIFNQLSNLLETFQTHSTSSSTFSHTGGFGDTIPQSSVGLGTAGRGLSGDSGVFTFAVFIMVIALFLLSGRPQPADDKRPNDDAIGRRRNFDTDFNDY